jgi:bifunctional non-homologous end joining protein LigD
MLASTAQAGDLTADGFRYEPKLDGWRALVYVCGGSVSIRSRAGRDLTPSLPELARPHRAVRDRDVVLDGELVAGQGRSDDFYRLAPLMAARRPHRAEPLTFVIFDVLWLDGVSVCARPYMERRRLLEELELDDACWQTPPAFDCRPADIVSACIELGLEGVVAKRLASRYRPGRRSRDWLKVKTPQWRAEHAARRHE